MKIIFCGGGTVGHISPAIAIAECLTEREKTAEILFVGRDRGPENKVITDSGFVLKTIEINGIERRISFNNIKNIYKAAKAQKTAKKIIKDFNPDVVVGTGGYVCWPVITAANRLGIPTAIHESNACPGLTAKLLAPRCSKVLLGLEGSQNEFKRKSNIFVVGNPVKKEFTSVNRLNARKKLGLTNKDFLICSFGGSGGSLVMNSAILNLMSSYVSKQKNLFHIHSCGKKYYENIKKTHSEFFDKKSRCIIKPYLENMPEIMAASDIVISRCGAITLAEICATGCVAILIPSPNVTNDHQRKNAELLVKSEAAIMISENELSERKLLDTIRKLQNNSQLRQNMKNAVKEFYISDCKEKTVNHLLELASKKD